MTTTFRMNTRQVQRELAEYVVAPIAPPGATLPVPTTGTSTDPGGPDWWIVAAAFTALAAAWWAAVNLISDDSFPPSGQPPPAAGLTILAVFFVAAQAIERLLEPLASLLDPKADQALSDASADAKDAVHGAALAQIDEEASPAAKAEASEAAQVALDAAAKKKATASRWRLNRRIIFWAVASAVAVFAASALKLYFLRTVGIAAPPRALDILATGLIIGAGTKPLHDLVTMISAKADATKSIGATSDTTVNRLV